MRTETALEPEPEPDRRRSRRVTLIVLAVSGVIGALWVVGPIVFAGHDDPTAIDSKPVHEAVVTACSQLRADLGAISPGTPAPARAEAENRAVDRLLATVRAVGPDALNHDNPVNQWLGDWEQIVAARRTAQREGKRFAVPFANGMPVNIRMFQLIRSGLDQCDVPESLLVAQPGSV